MSSGSRAKLKRQGLQKATQMEELGANSQLAPTSRSPAGLTLTAASLQDGGQGQRGAKTTMLDLGCRRCWQRLQQQDQVLLLRTAVAKRGLR